MQLCSTLSILWHCLSLGLEWKLTFSSPVATAEFSTYLMVKNLSAMWETQLRSLVWKTAWRQWLPIPVFLLGEFPELRSPAVYSPWSHKESDTTEWLTLSLSPYLKIYHICLVRGQVWAKTHGIRCPDPVQTPPASPGSHPTAWLGMLLSCFVHSAWLPFKSHHHVWTCAEVPVGSAFIFLNTTFLIRKMQHFLNETSCECSERVPHSLL